MHILFGVLTKKIVEETPGLHVTEVTRLLGAAWKSFSDVEKEALYREGKKILEQHNIENPNYKYKPKRKKTINKSKKLKLKDLM